MATSTVVVAREDLTIPGAVEAGSLDKDDPEHIENEFFKTLEESKADAVLLDLTASSGRGVAAIRRIRRRSAVPILVVCHSEDTLAADYRRAGATACMNPPIDLLQMKEALGPPNGGHPDLAEAPFLDTTVEGIRFADYVLQPRENRLIGPEGAEVALSPLETRVLQHLAETPGIVWPTTAIAKAVEADGGDADHAVGSFARLR